MRPFPPVESRSGLAAGDLAAQVAGLDRPVVFRGAVAGWPLVRTALQGADPLIAMLKAADTGRLCPTFRQAAGDGKFFYGEAGEGFNFARADIPLHVTLDRLRALMGKATSEHVYIQSAPLKDFLPSLKAGNTLLGIKAEPRIWIGNASITQTHFDLYDNLVCMVAGRKRFVIFPPDQAANLYMGPVETTISGVPTAMADLENPDFDTHPRFAEALEAATVAELEPGDVLFMPYMWWHHVASTSELNVQVNYWWNPAGAEMGQAMHALIFGLLNIRDLPPGQNAAWKAMFDQLVFHQSDPVAEHLRPEVRGLMGDMPAVQRTAIRQQIGKNLQED